MERASASRSTLARRSRWDSEWVSVSIAGPAACSAPEGSPIPLCGRIQLVGRAAGRRGAALRAAGPPGGWGPQARCERSEESPPAEARLLMDEAIGRRSGGRQQLGHLVAELIGHHLRDAAEHPLPHARAESSD